MSGLLDWMAGCLLRAEMAVRRFFTRLRCDEEGHPITWTSSKGESGCACGKLREIHFKRRTVV